jgi:hypothetical protein
VIRDPEIQIQEIGEATIPQLIRHTRSRRRFKSDLNGRFSLLACDSCLLNVLEKISDASFTQVNIPKNTCFPSTNSRLKSPYKSIHSTD